MDRFLALSADLTGFGTFSLQGTGEAQAYLDAAVGAVGAAVLKDLLDAHACVDGQGHAREVALRRQVLGDPRLGPVARNIIKMWFSGTWHALPPAWVTAYGAGGGHRTFAVRPSAYAEGLLWKTIGANPPGAKAPGYGSWAEPPQIPDPALPFSVLKIRQE